MTTETLTIQVPELLYRRLERLAALSGRPLESLITQTLSASIPPLPDDLPSPTRDALTSLEALSAVSGPSSSQANCRAAGSVSCWVARSVVAESVRGSVARSGRRP